MKRSEFKNKVKPIIRECIKEILFEEGVLSGIISEVIKNTNNNVVYETKKVEPQKELINERKEIKKKASATKKKLLDAIERRGERQKIAGDKGLSFLERRKEIKEL